MKLPKTKARIVRRAVDTLEQEQVLDTTTAGRVRANIEEFAFDWRRLARYSFLVAITCLIIALGAALADQWLMALLARIFRMPWSLKSLACALLSAAILLLGLRNDDGVLRGFGLTFLGINLYTRFFEFLWADLHKAIFFALLAVSFWFLGSRAESIWQLSRLRDRLRS